MKKIDRYIIRVSAAIFLLSILTCTLMFIVFDVFENLKRFIEFGENHSLLSTLGTVGLYYFYLVPSLIFIYLPFVTLLACIVTILVLNRKNEICTLQSFGISVRRLSVPFLVLGILVAAATSVSKEKIIPELYFKHLQVKNSLYYFDSVWNRSVKNIVYRENIGPEDIRKEIRMNHADRIWIREGIQLVSINLFDPVKNTALGITITRLNHQGDIIAQGNFVSGKWSQGRWTLSNGWLDIYNKKGYKRGQYNLRDRTVIIKELKVKLKEEHLYTTCTLSKKQLLMSKQKPETLSYAALNIYPEPVAAEIEQNSRLILPLFILTMLFTGVCIAIRIGISKLFFAVGLFIFLMSGFQVMDSLSKELAINSQYIYPRTAVLAEGLVLFSLILFTYKWANR